MPSGPKANKFTNRHSEEARQREEERAKARASAEAAAEEDAQWQETDAKVLKRLTKQREEEQKEAERAARRQEREAQLRQEEQELTDKVPKKVTQRQLQKDLTKMLANYDKEREAMRAGRAGALVDSRKSAALPQGNINTAKPTSVTAKEAEQGKTIVASGSPGAVLLALEEAGMSVATRANEQSKGGSNAVPDDRHIGKRAKMLYKLFYEDHIGEVRERNPGLRRSQLNDVVWKMWQKDPSNPFVLRDEARDHAALERERAWMQADIDDNDDDEEQEVKAEKSA